MCKPNINIVFLLISCSIYVDALKMTKVTNAVNVKTNQTVKEVPGNTRSSSQNKSHDFSKLRPVIREKPPKMISHDRVTQWASALSNELFSHEEKVVRRKEILKGFTNMKTEVRNGTYIIENVASILEDLFQRRAMAAEDIMRKVETLFEDKTESPPTYRYYPSKGLNKIKKDPVDRDLEDYEKPLNCSRLEPVHLDTSKHFDAAVSLDTSSMHIAAEVFDCDSPVVDSVHYTEELLQTFRNNYAQDAMLDFQYFCSAKGFLRHYPAASWESMVKLNFKAEDIADVYDCRLRPWYVSASGAPRDMLILLDASGSMTNSSKQVIAEIFISALLNALTDDDRVNVLRFHVRVESPIPCFEDKLVSANHVNTAAMVEALKEFSMENETKIDTTLKFAVKFLQKQTKRLNPPPSCQQAIVLITDSLYYNYTELMSLLDPEGKIRVFVMWLHDPRGLRDNTRELAKALTCSQDGYFAELLTHADVTLQVMQIFRVLERPLVSQRKKRLKVFSDVYAHIEDPRRAEYHWIEKENAEQAYRYSELRKNKEKIINDTELYKYHLYQSSLENYGHYYEGIDTNYRMMISVSVPVFEYTVVENITIQLDEEKQRNSTRQYPVNRLLGVAGVDIPVDHIKLLVPYYEIGPGGYFFLIDHRGSIVIHDNMKPMLDGDILKPGYRTVDILDLEQSAVHHFPRSYPMDWINFRHAMVIEQPKGTKQMHGKNIFDNGMRAALEKKEYHWRRIVNHYTAVIVLPPYGRERAVSDSDFTQGLAEEALEAFETDFAIHPDWLYCRHVEPYFDNRNKEFEHFLRRRSTDPKFRMQQLRHYFLPISPTIMERTYKCDEKLAARVCHDAIATKQWAKEHELLGVRDCSSCRLGSTTAFFTTENGLTRWQLYHATSEDAPPPEGYEWSKGPSEPWYRRAAMTPGRLVVHAPAYPVQHMRNTVATPKPLGARGKWLTAARTLNLPGKGEIGVAGFHFYPTHLDNMFDSITNFSCQEEDQEKCSARCDGKTWLCVLVDDAGWIVAGGTIPNEPNENGVRRHLATAHPGVMSALLNVSVFKLHWIHDYQAVCFAYEDEESPPSSSSSAASAISSFLISTLHTVSVLTRMAANTLFAVKLLWAVHLTQADTQKEIEKRRRRLSKDMAREMYDSLYDKRIVVNRTKYSACDRSRPVYELQHSSLSKLARPADPCSWPFVAAPVNQTNLLLIAIYMDCSYEGRHIPDPLVNEVVKPKDEDYENYVLPSSRLACWRNRVPLPGRLPHSTCYPHNYSAEEGYRQCGEWLPDPESGSSIWSPCNFLIFILILLII